MVKAQSKRYIYFLDADLNSTEKSKAVILGKGSKEDGLFKLECYAISDNHLFLILHFKDSTLRDIDGPSVNYHPNGRIEKEGSYINNNKEGGWLEWDSLGRKVDSSIYLHDKSIVKATFSYNKNDKLSYYTLKDSLQDTYQTISYDSLSAISNEVFFKGQKGIMKKYTKEGIDTDSLFTREEKEASFPGGDMGWSRYLKNNLNANTPINNRAPAGSYNVIVRFIVKNDGTIDNVLAETRFGYGMENEVIRIIKNGPKWIPASQYGRKVNAYRRQPVTFLVSDL